MARGATSASSNRANSSAILSEITPMLSATSSQVSALPLSPPIVNSLQTHNDNIVQRQHVVHDAAGMVPIQTTSTLPAAAISTAAAAIDESNNNNDGRTFESQ